MGSDMGDMSSDMHVSHSFLSMRCYIKACHRLCTVQAYAGRLTMPIHLYGQFYEPSARSDTGSQRWEIFDIN